MNLPTIEKEMKILTFHVDNTVLNLHFNCISPEQQRYIRERYSIEVMDEDIDVNIHIGLDNINQLTYKGEVSIPGLLRAKQTVSGWAVFGRQYNVLLEKQMNEMAVETILKFEYEDKTTTKLRIVFDASSGAQLLNQALFKGVND